MTEAEVRAPCIDFGYHKLLPSRRMRTFCLTLQPSSTYALTGQAEQADGEHTCGDVPGRFELPGNGRAGALCRLPKRAVLLVGHEQRDVRSPRVVWHLYTRAKSFEYKHVQEQRLHTDASPCWSRIVLADALPLTQELLSSHGNAETVFATPTRALRQLCGRICCPKDPHLPSLMPRWWVACTYTSTSPHAG